MGVIESLLGKHIESLKCDEFQQRIAEIDESPYIEFKGYHSQDWNKIKDVALVELISFLNTEDGEGLLILGFDEKRKTLTPLPPDVLELKGRPTKNAVESKFRDTILSHIKTLPPNVTPPILKVKVFESSECNLSNHGFIVLMHIIKKADVLYYYDKTNLAYIREGSKKRPLTLPETFNILQRKSRPLLELIPKQPKIDNNNNLQLHFLIKNLGNTPATSVVIILSIPKSYGENVRAWPSNIVIEDSKNILRVQKNMMPSLNTPIYPALLTGMTDFSIIIEKFSGYIIIINAGIFTMNNKTIETITLSPVIVAGTIRWIVNITMSVIDYTTQSPIYEANESFGYP